MPYSLKPQNRSQTLCVFKISVVEEFFAARALAPNVNVDLQAAGGGCPKGARWIEGDGSCGRTGAQGGDEALGLDSYERHGRLQGIQEYEAKYKKRKCSRTVGDRRGGDWGLGVRAGGRRGSVVLHH